MLNIFGKKKLLLSFEYGVTLAKVAQEMKVEITKELMERAEDILLKEFNSRHSMELGMDMGMNLLAIFQPKELSTDGKEKVDKV